MASLAKRLASWTYKLRYEDIPAEVVEETKKRVLDSFGVAIGAFFEEPPSIARAYAMSTSSHKYGATIWGTTHRSAPDHATFANGCGVRYFDFNDTYLGKEALHPSDNIPAILAAAEMVDADGKQVIEGIVVAYEIAGRLADAYSIRAKGWDHVTYIAISSALGAGKVLGLNEEQLTHAINIALTTNNALRQTRAGELSMWKGCAAANSARNGLFAAILAKNGMTGPAPVFEGEMGFFNIAIGGDKFNVPVLAGENGAGFKLLETSIKYWPVEYHAMSAVEAALKIREKAGNIKPEDIEEVFVKTFDVAYKIIVKDPEKWDPKTRETADHSLPYIIAAALLDGYVWMDTFREQRILADDVRKVMSKMKVVVDEEHNKIYPTGIKNTIHVKLKDGREFEESSTYPPGHFKNPLDRHGVEAKFEKLVKGLLPKDAVKEIEARVWRLEQLDEVGKTLRLMKIVREKS
ncbi:MAG: MmgE/PrpD family protein [Desulfurococcales archaeon]|nr:MmgE/PrpD family protein [Desulfurococcales archaeon]